MGVAQQCGYSELFGRADHIQPKDLTDNIEHFLNFCRVIAYNILARLYSVQK